MDQVETWHGGNRPSRFGLDGDSALPSTKGHSFPIFGPCLSWPNGWLDQDATWYGGRPRPRPRCVRWARTCSFEWLDIHFVYPASLGGSLRYSARLSCLFLESTPRFNPPASSQSFYIWFTSSSHTRSSFSVDSLLSSFVTPGICSLSRPRGRIWSNSIASA